ncbi:tetratricopeptide repeat protein [Streptomyces coeruleoprunus]|uniref:Tetratricopeptide repeat protein n=1 Tax=Streptomyces coeruleoprunus TaxID=285563 RepID=A0ABV9XGB0_9ACTN
MTSASGDRSAAAGGDIGWVNTGDFLTHVDHATLLPPEALAPAECPPGLVHLPGRTGEFVGRRGELAALDAAFATSTGVVVQAVHGLGGIGKSTLAARWAATRMDDHDPVWWIDAETPAALEAGLAALAAAMQPVLAAVLPQEALRERAVQWLSAHDGWLLVLDNVSDPADVRPLLDRARRGRFLITTRRATGWHGIARTLALDVLTLPEAVRLFTGIHRGVRDGVSDLCHELGCLPLAVEQAAAYCVEAGIGPRAYLDLLAGHPAAVLAGIPEGADERRAVARVWRVTLDRLADTPLAGTILRVLAWWDANGIPRAYLAPLGSPPEVTEAVRRLVAHSMITSHADGTLSVHRLVQAVARTADEEDPHRRGELVEEGRETAVDLLARCGENLQAAPPQDRRAWAGHMEALVSSADPATDSEKTAIVLAAAATVMYLFSGRRALALGERASAGLERHQGPDSEARLNLGWLLAMLLRTEDADRATAIVRDTLAGHERAFGADDARTRQARRYATAMLHDMALHKAKNALPAARLGDEAALRTLHQALADAPREVLHDHDGRLIQECLDAGRTDAAIRLAERRAEKLAEREGPTSLLAFGARAALVLIVHVSGRADAARELATALLAECEAVYGADGFTQELRRFLSDPPHIPRTAP